MKLTEKDVAELTNHGPLSAHINYRESRSYTNPGSVVSLYVNGDFQTRCHGGGYDMSGTVLGEWLAKAFPERLKKIYTDSRGIELDRDDGFIYLSYGNLHGLYQYKDKVRMDGACGIREMEFMLNLLGYSWSYFKQTRVCTDYLISRLTSESYEHNKLSQPALLKVKKGAKVLAYKGDKRAERKRDHWFHTGRIGAQPPAPKEEHQEFIIEDVFSEKFCDFLGTERLLTSLHSIDSLPYKYRYGGHYLNISINESDATEITWKEIIDGNKGGETSENVK